MHAFLLIGHIDSQQSVIDELANKFGAKVMEFPLIKIDDVRSLNHLTRLSFDKPTLIVCRDIHEAGEEALNAFLKNLEEPQDNVYYALTTPSIKKVLPTIVSRCQIIKIANSKSQDADKNDEEFERFFKMNSGEKLAYTDKIRDRKIAIEFAENMVIFMHRSLHKKELKYSISLANINLAIETLSRLKANGNVNLQLSNFVINSDN